MINRTNHEKVEVHLIPKSKSTKKDAVDTLFYVLAKTTVVNHLSCAKERSIKSPVPSADVPFAK
jgi:hypothetical protein